MSAPERTLRAGGRTVRLGGGPRTTERILRHDDVQGSVDEDHGGQHSGRRGKASREANGHPPHGQFTMILLANIAP